MEGRTMADQKCKGDHTQHICALAQEKKFEVIKQLTIAPQYICTNCGRASDKSENLCNPLHINQIGFM
jgi:hypothetical protein